MGKPNSADGKPNAIEAKLNSLESGLKSIDSKITKTEKTVKQEKTQLGQLSETLETRLKTLETATWSVMESINNIAKHPKLADTQFTKNSDREIPDGVSLPHLDSPNTQMVQISESRFRALEATMGSLTESIENITLSIAEMENTHLPENSESENPGGFSLPELDFPKFGGENPWFWVSDCETFFDLVFVPERKKVLLAALHMEGRARNWYRCNAEELKGALWSEFANRVCKRFSRSSCEVMSDFRDLRQEGSVEEYMGKFEELQFLISREFEGLSGDLYMTYFLTGLKDEIKYKVMNFQPKSIVEAFHLARSHEKDFEY